MTQLVERKAYEFTIVSSEELDEEQEFLALQNVGRPEFVLYWSNPETGDYEYACAPDSEEALIDSAIDYMVAQWSYTRSNLTARAAAP